MADGMSRTTPSCWYRPCHWLLAAHLRLLADFPRGGTGACWAAADCTVRTTSTITVLTIILDETVMIISLSFAEKVHRYFPILFLMAAPSLQSRASLRTCICCGCRR